MYLELKCEAGDYGPDVADQMSRMASALNFSVGVVFNDVLIRAWPGDTPLEILELGQKLQEAAK